MSESANSKYRIAGDQIRELVSTKGICFATNRITVDGKAVGFMYREEKLEGVDTGWRFFAGDETEGYVDEADHIEIFEVNTIANYDEDIIPLLESPPGSAFERDEESGKFVEVTMEED